MLQSGDVIGGRYTIRESLSSGGFGQTFTAEDTQRPGNPKCVVKQLKLLNGTPQQVEIARKLFQREAEILEKLGRECNRIPQLLAHFEQDEEFYIVQEFIEGKTLAQELQESPRWNEKQALTFLQEILPTLEFVHKNDVIHRDIKPANLIRRTSDNAIFLIDFGAIKQVFSSTVTSSFGTNSTIAVGTLGYMPTEQAAGKPRKSSDIYALGVTVIQALTGIAPTNLQEDDHGELIWEPYAQVSPAFVSFLSRMVKHNFNDRYPDASATIVALDSYLKGDLSTSIPTVTLSQLSQPTVPIATVPTTQNQPPKKGGFNFLGFALLLILLSGGGGFGYWFFEKTRAESEAVARLKTLLSTGKLEDCIKDGSLLSNPEAQSIVKECQEKLQQNSENFLKIARESLANNKFDECIAATSSITQNDPNYPQAKVIASQCEQAKASQTQQQILAELNQLKEKGDYDSCISKAGQVSATSSIYAEATVIGKECERLKTASASPAPTPVTADSPSPSPAPVTAGTPSPTSTRTTTGGTSLFDIEPYHTDVIISREDTVSMGRENYNNALSIHYGNGSIYWNLKGRFTKLNLTVGMDDDRSSSSWVRNPRTLYFYGDGKLLKRTKLSPSDLPSQLEIDVKGVQSLEIRVKSEYGSGKYINIVNSTLR